MGGRGCAGWSGVKGGKWDNCNSIINKIYFKKPKKNLKKLFIKKKKKPPDLYVPVSELLQLTLSGWGSRN